MAAISQTDFSGIPLFRRGKVRDVYDLGENLLFVATDRLSAFDVVMPEPIPMKGAVLTGLSLFWFEQTKGICRNHVVASDPASYPPACAPHAEALRGRSMIVRKTTPLAIECVVRGYLAGSGWKEYRKSGTVCGIALPGGLRESSPLPEPIFTPSTKAEVGHDENIPFEEAAAIAGREVAEEARRLSLALYTHAHAIAQKKGIIIADTKFEFGVRDGEMILIDEALTPDSSRFWPLEGYAPGRPQPSFDKQYVRDYLESISWNKQPPAPHLPEEVVRNTTKKYIAAYELISGKPFPFPL